MGTMGTHADSTSPPAAADFSFQLSAFARLLRRNRCIGASVHRCGCSSAKGDLIWACAQPQI
jgi:hypothetical protein